MTVPLISSQRFLDPKVVQEKAQKNKIFIVSTMTIDLRGKSYRVLLDGHHNLAAARLLGVEPVWRGPSQKVLRTAKKMGIATFARTLINNLTDSDWYDVETGCVVGELLGTEQYA